MSSHHQIAEQCAQMAPENARPGQRAYGFGKGNLELLLPLRRQSVGPVGASLSSRMETLKARVIGN
ncbi:hypothetical protein [Alicycliphilus denitrificans]|jgi:hypothetical protein|uniref:hypothetical protein n=1 Tax=Alicycliphilus denitrificans TaxID=179636 RepID=UPI0011D2B64D|nr:hypothetical protein [Alicycliphilus denitrificans]MBS0435337.1 hypothetical protein [Pseudomonadota bacterium]MBS0499598.1 hypothetical protein [Pseudomonadota bacterium]MBZ0226272.1 hypothetical protein [Comamonas sp.]HOV19703.1 hypothetical protein [Ottowia sp.]